MKAQLQYLSMARTALSNGYEQRADFYFKLAEHLDSLSLDRNTNSKIEVELYGKEPIRIGSLREFIKFLRRMQK